MSYATKQKKVAGRKRAAAIKRNAMDPNASWRSEPATERQWVVLRKIGRATGGHFPEDITRGQASKIITERFQENPAAQQASRRAYRARQRAARQEQESPRRPNRPARSAA